VLLAIYLNDHLAGATVGRDLARRASASNNGPIYGGFLQQLAVEIDEDRESLIRLMEALDVSVDRFKVFGGWAAEKVGRLKGLTLGVRGKLGLWLALKELEREDQRMTSVDLQELAERAERQLHSLEKHRLRAVPEALLS
jgi:hypothetical protein